MLAGLQLDASLVETLDMIGDDRRLARLHRLEKIGVGDEAQPLIPRVVGRGEGDGVIAVTERGLQPLGQEFLDLFGLFARAAEADVLQSDILKRVILYASFSGRSLRRKLAKPSLR